jgi:uncharacterized protein YggE
MEEPMSPMFDTRLLRKRWFHMPAFAVIALAATTAFVGDRAIDAWSAWKRPMPAPEGPNMTNVIGKAELAHIKPDHVSWTVTTSVATKKRAEIDAMLAQKTQLALQELLDQGIGANEIRVGSPTIEEETADSAEGQYRMDGTTIDPVVTGYTGSQDIGIQSRRVSVSVDAFNAISTHVRSWLAITPPECWLEDDAAIRAKLQETAWADVQRQHAIARSRFGHAALGRLTSISQNEVDLQTSRDSWACTEGQTSSVTIVAAYELR